MRQCTLQSRLTIMAIPEPNSVFNIPTQHSSAYRCLHNFASIIAPPLETECGMYTYYLVWVMNGFQLLFEAMNIGGQGNL